MTTTTTMTKAGTALMTAIGNWTGSFFDGGIVAGEGIWHDNLTGEAAGFPGVPNTPKGVAGVIRRLAEQGYLEIQDQNDDGVWVALTEQGAATANALGEQADAKPTQTAEQPKKAASQPKAAKTPQKAGQPKGKKASDDAPMPGTVKFYRLRKSGTARRLPYLAPGTPERKEAEKVAAQVAKGKSIAELAQSTQRSVSTVRRMVAAVQLAEDFESGTYADAVQDGKVVLPAREQDDK